MTERLSLSRKTREAIKGAQGDRCFVCGIELGGKFEVDHRQALVHGGDNSRGNLAALCIPCHAGKTRIDVKNNAKVKRSQKKMQVIKREPGEPKPPSNWPIRKLQSRPFPPPNAVRRNG